MSLIRSEKLAIPLASIKEGVTALTFQTAYNDLRVGEGCTFSETVDVKATVTKMVGDYLVRIEVRTLGRFVCDRCDESFELAVAGKLDVLYTNDSEKAEGNDSGDCHYLESSAQEIEITQDVRDALVLALPAKHLCRRDCQGLCAHCGVNLNVSDCACGDKSADPRWDALKGLKFDD